MDKAILYNTTLGKVDKRLNELKSIGFKMDEFTKVRDEIVNTNKANVQKSYNFASPNLSLGQSAFLEQDYTNSINSLEKLYSKMLDYEIYVVAYHTTKLVQEFLNNDNKSEEEFAKYREKIELVLRNISNSKTLDYNVEGPIIEEIYNVVYLFIKEEMAYLDNSILLDKLSEVDKYYIDKLVKKDIENIDLRKRENKLISLKVKEIESKGFNSSFANKELIMAIVGNNSNILERRKLIINDLNIRLECYYNSIKDIYNDLNYIVEPKYDKRINRNLSKNSLKLFLNLSVAAGLIIGSIKSAKFDATKKVETYMTKTTTYNPLGTEPYEITEQYEPKKDKELVVYDYGTVIEEENKRAVTEYDLSDYQSLSMEELYNMDLASLVLPENTEILSNDEISLDSFSDEAFRIINKINVNLEDMQEITEIDEFSLAILTSLFMIIAALLCIFCWALEYYKSNIKYYAIITDIKRIYLDLRELKNYHNENIVYKKKLKNITSKLNKIITDNKDLLDKATLYSKLETKNEYQKEINCLRRNLLLLEETRKDLQDKIKSR